jgi:hypothetical protein
MLQAVEAGRAVELACTDAKLVEGDARMSQFLAQFVYLVCPEKQKIALLPTSYR